MASKRTLKKNVNYVMGDIIEAAFLHQMVNPKGDQAKSEAIVENAMRSYDELITKINDKSVEDKGKHLKAVNKQLEEKAHSLVKDINALNA
ncbi:hypothetical protein ACFQ3R_06685 [Mesonia ostreae]|uniref:Uncharacterized protein n=1 Tax=Mesonia ostreae TaxID=861110 RepID=A0ABU2KMB6_9FLAO|nr:hypothetical protein [Mesonia ostreae]MDT0295812.1 hypothetical protein [Mesonia ostreae]